jgi:hypothetical protein
MKQTAVEWLAQKFEELLLKLDFNEISDEEYLEETEHIVIIAKEMEKEQIILSHINGQSEYDSQAFSSSNTKIAEQYYNEQFKNK